MAKRNGAQVAILWDSLRKVWEAWCESRPVAESVKLDRLLAEYPDALVGPGPEDVRAFTAGLTTVGLVRSDPAADVETLARTLAAVIDDAVDRSVNARA